MTVKEKGNKALRLSLAVIYFFGALVCLFWLFITFLVFLQMPLGYLLFAAFLASVALFVWEGIRWLRKPRESKLLFFWVLIESALSGFFMWLAIRMVLQEPSFDSLAAAILMCMVPAYLSALAAISRIREKPTGKGGATMTKKKKEGKWWALGVFASLFFCGFCAVAGFLLIVLEHTFGATVIAILICFAPACFFGGLGISKIKGKIDSKPEKTGKAGNGRRWWLMRFLRFVGPRLYGASATLIQRPLMKKRVRGHSVNTLGLLFDILRERVLRSRPWNMGKALAFVDAVRILWVAFVILIAPVMGVLAFVLVVYIDPGTLASAIVFTAGLFLVAFLLYRRRRREKEYNQVNAMMSG